MTAFFTSRKRMRLMIDPFFDTHILTQTRDTGQEKIQFFSPGLLLLLVGSDDNIIPSGAVDQLHHHVLGDNFADLETQVVLRLGALVRVHASSKASELLQVNDFAHMRPFL